MKESNRRHHHPQQQHIMLKSVFVLGATHGNERAGIHLAKLFNQHNSFFPNRWPSLSIQGIVANEKAALANTRYVDEDLNRCFTSARLSSNPISYESTQAQKLNLLLGPKSSKDPKADFIFDLHNSTSNTGMMLCMHRHDTVALEVAAHLFRVNPEVKIVFWSADTDDQPFLPTVSRSGMTVEFGPVSHGTVNFSAMDKVRKLVLSGLDYLQSRTTSKDTEEVLVHVGERKFQVDFPRDEKSGEMTGFIHPMLQGINELVGDNYLRPGQPMFVNVLGEVVKRFDPHEFPSSEKLFPVFVNEAAYFEKKVAFFLYSKDDTPRSVKVHSLRNQQSVL